MTIRVAGVEVQSKLMRYLGKGALQIVRGCRHGQSNCPALWRPYLPARRNLSSKPKRRKQLVPGEKGQQEEIRKNNSLKTHYCVLFPESSWRPRFNSCHKEWVHHLAPHGQPPVTQGLTVSKFLSVQRSTGLRKFQSSKRKAIPSLAKGQSWQTCPIESNRAFMFEMHHQPQGISDQLKQHYRVTQGHKRADLEGQIKQICQITKGCHCPPWQWQQQEEAVAAPEGISQGKVAPQSFKRYSSGKSYQPWSLTPTATHFWCGG